MNDWGVIQMKSILARERASAKALGSCINILVGEGLIFWNLVLLMTTLLEKDWVECLVIKDSLFNFALVAFS